MLAEGPDIEEKGGQNACSPLHAAVISRFRVSSDSAVVLLLLDKGADVSSRDNGDDTPLHRAVCPRAARDPYEALVLLLLERGADVAAKRGCDGATPLHVAAHFYQKGELAGEFASVVPMLLRHGAEVSAPNNSGETPLHCACRKLWGASSEGHDAIVLVLLESGADVSATDSRGGTPLHEAANCGREAAVRFLLDKGANEKLKTNHGDTPSDMATKYWGSGIFPRIAAILEAEGARRARWLAFAMGHQERLGAGSRVQALDPGVVRMVLDRM